eukprot:TRINITY_DN636_c0_g1_i1.p1 TRINITY_DN636_c0_g1~~TRINITY_DN636_c0_g1_i1.p1  ORF type:complete len:166 (+),score=18.76 TRINITY_DN636_c0_g1_i1:41-538(+)
MSTLKTELCHFSHFRLHPGHGKKYARVDGKIFNFMTRKCARCYQMKRNPRDTRWTIHYRKKNKKGQIAEVSRKRTRKTVKYKRAIQGSTLEKILQLRNQTSQVRKLQREQALKIAKEKTKQKKAVKSAEKKPKQATKSKDKSKAPKQSKKQPAQKGVKKQMKHTL